MESVALLFSRCIWCDSTEVPSPFFWVVAAMRHRVWGSLLLLLSPAARPTSLPSPPLPLPQVFLL